MHRKKTKALSAKATLAEVTKEMAKPRVAMSAREPSTFRREAVVANAKKSGLN
jgi:hypothetical protein